jgi:hypothetical protein
MNRNPRPLDPAAGARARSAAAARRARDRTARAMALANTMCVDCYRPVSRPAHWWCDSCSAVLANGGPSIGEWMRIDRLYRTGRLPIDKGQAAAALGGVLDWAVVALLLRPQRTR